MIRQWLMKMLMKDSLVYGVGVVTALMHLYINVLATFAELTISALHFACFTCLTLLIKPISQNKLSLWHKVFDISLAVLAISAALYLLCFEDALYARGSQFNLFDWLAAISAIIVALEMVRRVTGCFIPLLTLVALSYVFWWGAYIEGVFSFPGLSLETVLYRSYFTTEGMFGPIARISWSFVFMFILFGAFLVRSGAGDFIIALARTLAGKMVGGPGLVAVFGSGLMGSVSGSSVANTVSTGVITIPLMTRVGFPAKFAAAVEAAASTGGQLMPPVMGAGVFIMASYTQISYLDIIAYALLPACLYFLSVGFYVRVEAKKQGIVCDQSHADSVFTVVRQGWYSLLPLCVLVALLIYGFTPTYAAGLSIIAVIVASWLGPRPMTIKAIFDALSQGANNMATTAMLLIAIGLIVNVVAMTGIGNVFSLMVSQWAGDSLFITIVLIAIASLILGMGLPVTASYIVLATLAAPAIYILMAENQLLTLLMQGQLPEAARSIFMLLTPEHIVLLQDSMSLAQAKMLLVQVPDEYKHQLIELALAPESLTMLLLSAHMIIFWLSQDSNVTPPVCLTAFAAAAIAKTPPMATGFKAWKIAKALYIIPLLFAYTGLLTGDLIEMLTVFVFATLALYAMVGFVEGYLEAKLTLLTRILSGGCCLLMLWPHSLIELRYLAAAIFIGIFYLSSRQDQQAKLAY